jgi:hypothetical protein
VPIIAQISGDASGLIALVCGSDHGYAGLNRCGKHVVISQRPHVMPAGFRNYHEIASHVART